MRWMRLEIRILAVAGFLALLTSFPSYAASGEADESFTVEKSGEISDPEAAEELFEQEIKRGDRLYRLDVVDVTVNERKPKMDETVSTETEFFPMYKESGELFDVKTDTVIKDGYELIEVATQSYAVPASVQYVEVTQEYAYMTEKELPQTAEAKYIDPNTGEVYTKNVPLIGIETEEEAWVEGKDIELIFNDYNAKTYIINGTIYQNNGEPDIAGNENFIIEAAGLEPERTKIREIVWDGEAYQKGGRTYRKALARIVRLQKRLVGTYGGEIEIPEGECVRQVATYRYTEYTPSETEMIYKVDAVGTYILADDGKKEEAESRREGIPVLGRVAVAVAGVALLGTTAIILVRKKIKRDAYLGRKYK